ncbi:MAG TPA: hypothetical protein VFQ05_15580 [Candidatus Eisenbacteria bacterium]|nr:hypothetical protein [Candidatus Eisenbacteria bacterium]
MVVSVRGRRELPLIALLALLASAARAEPVDAPAGVAEGEDVTYEENDSLAVGEVELGLAVAGSSAKKPQHRRRVRFDEPDFSGALREGSGDPLSGGEVTGRSASDRFVLGKLSPRWGRGLLLGSPGEPWQRATHTMQGGRRGRAGEGLLLSRGHERRVELVAGRFARRDLAGLRVGHRAVGVGVLVGRGRELQSSLAVRRGAGEIEAALDRGGSWRAEGLLERPLGVWSAAGTVRAGAAGFRSLAEPARQTPTRAVAMTLTGPAWGSEMAALAGVWRFRAGQSGSRVALECRRSMGDGRLVLGFEEQQGVRKDAVSAAGAMRQGGWIEWSGGAPLALGVRHETWSARALLQDVVRSVTSTRVDARAPLGIEVTLAHSIFRTRRGESLYLAEAESDRLVLRALSGEGQRSKLEVLVPAGRRGRVLGTLLVHTASGVQKPPQWSIEWIRRSRADRTP